MKALQSCRARLANAPLHARSGRLRGIRGLLLESDGPDARLGELCRIEAGGAEALLAEVVAVHDTRLSLLAYGSVQGLQVGASVTAQGEDSGFPVGPGLLGRVVDAFGRPLDGGPALSRTTRCVLRGDPVNPMERPPVQQVLETGIRCIDALFTLGRGQRIGLFAGSGVGKSSLLAAIARHAKADLSVIALVGERSREVRGFVHDVLGPVALQRSVVIAASSDQPAPARVRAAHAAVAAACHFASQGLHVLLMVDSMTRLALARREIGLAAGEPPTARGFTPSVFAELPQLCERCGTFASGGTVTALLTVLVEGDDMNEPVADSLRSVLDGHLVLSRELAHRGHHPAIDVLRSVSRLQRDLADQHEAALVARAVALFALLERHRDPVELGIYQKGTHAALDAALALQPALEAWLRQPDGPVDRASALQALRAILDREPA